MFLHAAIFRKAPLQGSQQHGLSTLRFMPHFMYLHWLGKEMKAVFDVPVNLFCLELFGCQQDK